MLEIILVVYLSQRLAKVCKAKGRPGAWGALFAGGWIVGEFLGAIFGAIATQGDTLGTYGIALLGAAAGGTAAWFVVSSLSPLAQPLGSTYMPTTPNLPGTMPDAPIPGAVPEPPKPVRRAAYCMECGTNVWLTGTGSCPNGHGPQSLTNCYTVEG